MHMVEKILNNTTPYGKIRASHEGSLNSSTLNKGSVCELHLLSDMIRTLVFFTYSTARRLSGRHMYMFSRHRKLDFCKIISFISGLEC